MRILFSILLLAGITYTSTHGLDLENNFLGMLDNREYGSSVQSSQTIFGAIEEAEIGASIDSGHAFRAGVSCFMEFGAPLTADYIDPVLYYRFTNQRSTFLFGSFLRRQVLTTPVALLQDSARYYRPCVEGAFYQWRFRAGQENIWIDWTGRQTTRKRETFLVGLSGEVYKGPLFFSHHILYYHYAGRKNVIPKDYLRDNGGILVSLGCQFLEKSVIDSLRFHCDGIVSYDRIRSEKAGWHTPVGIQAGLQLLAFQRFGGEFLYYHGVYKEHNQWHRMVWGEPIYTAKSFGKCDLMYVPIISEYVRGKFLLTFYFVEKQVDSRQLFLVDVCFGRRFSRKKED